MKQGGRTLIRINGRTMSERQAGRLAGTQGARTLARLGFDASPVARRARYFAFRGSKRERARDRAAIADLIVPYPRRQNDGLDPALLRARIFERNGVAPADKSVIAAAGASATRCTPAWATPNEHSRLYPVETHGK